MPMSRKVTEERLPRLRPGSMGRRHEGAQADDHQWDSEVVQFGSVFRSLLED
jgi:hypothetical protein